MACTPPATSDPLSAPFCEFEKRCLANSAAYHGDPWEGSATARSDSSVVRRRLFQTASGGAPQTMGPNEPVTVFHTREWIPMGLHELAVTMQKANRCTDEALLAALVLCCRYSHSANTPVTRHMMHRLFVASLHVCLKTHCDRFLCNAAYAKVSGVTAQELNRLEHAVIHGLRWRCCVLVEASSTIATLAADSVRSAAAVESNTSAPPTFLSLSLVHSTPASTGGSTPSHLAGSSHDGSFIVAARPAGHASTTAPGGGETRLSVMPSTTICARLRGLPSRSGVVGAAVSAHASNASSHRGGTSARGRARFAMLADLTPDPARSDGDSPRSSCGPETHLMQFA